MASRVLVVGCAAVLGLVAVVVSGAGPHGPAGAIADLLTGWTVLACGLLAWSRRPDSRIGVLLVATGGAWFVGDLGVLEGPIGVLASEARFVHRALVLHCLLAFPTGRLASWSDRSAVVAGYVVALATPLVGYRPGTWAMSVLVVVAVVVARARSNGRERSARTRAMWAGALFAVTMAGGVVARWAVPTAQAVLPVVLGYEVALCVVAISLTVGLLDRSSDRAALADLVIELGDEGGSTLRSALAGTLGDPELEVGFWDSAQGTFLDDDGHPVAEPAPRSGRLATTVEHGGAPVALVVLGAAVPSDPALLEAVVAAIRLAVANRELRAEVARQVHEVRESRERLLRAADDEGRRLELRLRDGAGRTYRRVGALLDDAGAAARSDETRADVDALRAELGRTQDQLSELARGLRPTVLQAAGLAAALAALVARSPVQVELVGEIVEPAEPVRSVVYFVTAEALTNVAKHAQASTASISVACAEQWVRVEVVDDGVGGVVPPYGSGLRGLFDRVAGAGGRLSIDSPPGGGTRLVALLPTA